MSEKRVILLEPDDAFLAKKQRIAEKLKAVSKPPKAARKKKTGIIAKFKKDVASAAAAPTEQLVPPAPVSHTRKVTDVEGPVRQNITAAGIGSRAELVDFRAEIEAVNTRAKRAITFVKNQGESLESKKILAPLEKINSALQEYRAKFDTMLQGNTTLTVIEASRWRTAPNSRIFGLVLNNVDVERDAELARRLAITPLPAADTNLDIADYKKALAHELTTCLSGSSSYELLASAQNAMFLVYQRIVEKAPSAKRAELRKKLDGLRELHKEVLAGHVQAIPHNATAPLQDPLANASIVPPH